MVPTGQCDEPSPWDVGGQLAPRLEWNYAVVARVHNKRRRLHFGQKFNDIDIAGYTIISSRALGGGRSPLQSLK